MFNRRAWFLVCSAIVVVCSATWDRPAFAQTTPRIHVLVIGTTKDPIIGETVEVDLRNIGGVFRANVPANQLAIWTVEGKQATVRGVGAAIKKIGSGFTANRDILLIYISSHGEFDPNAGEHIANLVDGNLNRAQLRRDASVLQPRLTVILTDSCSVLRRDVKELTGPTGAPAAAPIKLTPAFKSLFFDLAGLVDISATKRGEKAGCNKQVGGFFTSAFCGVVSESAHRPLRWSQVVDSTNQRVQRFWSPDQTAYAISRLPDAGSVGVPRMRFGVFTERTDRSAKYDGVEIVRVIKGTPGQSVVNLQDNQTYHLPERQHVITHVNGDPVRSRDEFDEAVERSPETMRFRMKSLRSKRTDDYQVKLLAPNAIRFGVTAENTVRSQGFGGVEVIDVVPGYPGTRITNERDGREYTLVPGVDFITEVNGRQIGNFGDLQSAVGESPRRMSIRVYDSYHKTRDTYSVELDD